MATIDIINGSMKKVGSAELGDTLLTEKLNKAVLYQAVRANLSTHHHGTVNTKTRADVWRTGKKLYKQKGTGGARHGSRKTAPFVGGGRVFGPHPRDYTIRLPRKVRVLAMREALRCALIEKNVTVVQEFPFKTPKTKEASQFFSAIKVPGGLVILDKASDVVEKSIRNLKGFKILRVDQLSPYEILKYQKLIFTADAFAEAQKRYL